MDTHYRVVDVDTFARQLITDKCSELIENESLLPANILHVVKQARDKYFEEPSPKNYEYVKKLFLRTKYMDDSIDYKNFNRRVLLIVFKFALNRSSGYFPSYKELIEVAVKRLNKINPDLKSSPRAMLQHYNECLENLDSPVTDEHHLVTFGKEVATKIFIEAFEFSYTSTNEIQLTTTKPAADALRAVTNPQTTTTVLLNDVMCERKRKLGEFKPPQPKRLKLTAQSSAAQTPDHAPQTKPRRHQPLMQQPLFKL
ncbi:ORF48 peptide [Hyphantria cunea nucleopolyhedrovirus]|uniref:ORF48 peptide n=1 Tax=Hyphantria cunea nuclear polyhedrosis virus TaxID=28288 RepID=Q2NNY5_NPVHC|nr:ORF48 peptide [Hyphantria cunea nucleopolyhedrovirus]BAE72337.1 ORF48 peptide [Hyphantria cunea nucleopolyhedrovirus]